MAAGGSEARFEGLDSVFARLVIASHMVRFLPKLFSRAGSPSVRTKSRGLVQKFGTTD